jgi:hypothetical protein
MLGTSLGPNGYPLCLTSDGGWVLESGEAVNIAIGSEGAPWVADSRDRIYVAPPLRLGETISNASWTPRMGIDMQPLGR